MKSKCFLLLTLFTYFFLPVFAQSVTRPLYNLKIYKSVNDKNHKPDKFVEIDSAGNIYVQSGHLYNPKEKLSQTIDIKKLSAEVTKYVTIEKLDKFPGNNFEEIQEAPTIKLNQQYIEVTIMFLDDIRKEKKLLNKTYYSWNDFLDKTIQDYPLFKYLNVSELEILKPLLE
jgi:hypothetical protein